MKMYHYRGLWFEVSGKMADLSGVQQLLSIKLYHANSVLWDGQHFD